MSDGITREPTLRPDWSLPEHLLTDEQVGQILARIDDMDRSFLIRHMRASEMKAHADGVAAGAKQVNDELSAGMMAISPTFSKNWLRSQELVKGGMDPQVAVAQAMAEHDAAKDAVPALDQVPNAPTVHIERVSERLRAKEPTSEEYAAKAAKDTNDALDRLGHHHPVQYRYRRAVFSDRLILQRLRMIDDAPGWEDAHIGDITQDKGVILYRLISKAGGTSVDDTMSEMPFRRWRLRIGWLGALVLEVGERTNVNEIDDFCDLEECGRYRKWRDARIQDMFDAGEMVLP